jgi:uncharacterized protein (TIGR03067 family)
MRASVALVLTACVLIAGRARADDEATRKELALLQGTWVIVGKEYGGKKATEEEVANLAAEVKPTVDGTKIKWSEKLEKKENASEATFKIDPKARPKTLDVTYTGGRFKGDTVLAIYEIDGDTLKVCYATTEDGKPRPTEFAGKADGKAVLMTYKRAKK